jgi:hypothetical protein
MMVELPVYHNENRTCSGLINLNFAAQIGPDLSTTDQTNLKLKESYYCPRSKITFHSGKTVLIDLPFTDMKTVVMQAAAARGEMIAVTRVEEVEGGQEEG